jgi:predicted branched-subunit amino acid permease
VDWATALFIGLGCGVGYLLATRKQRPEWTEEQRAKHRRYRWWGFIFVVAWIVGLGFVPDAAHGWMDGGLCAAVIAFLVWAYRRGTRDRTALAAMLIVAAFFLLLGVAWFVPGDAGIGVFVAGCAVLLVGNRVLRHRTKPLDR